MKKVIATIFLLWIGSYTIVPCEAKIHKGQTKDGVTYQYNTKSKTLTLSGKIVKGTWKKQQEERKENPWDRWQNKAKKIVFKKGVETVTNGAFDNFVKVKTIVLPKTLKK